MICAFINLGKHFGGAENYLLTIIARWIDDGNSAVVIARNGTAFARCAEESLPGSLIQGVDLSIKDARKVRRMLKQYEVDLIHINGINSGTFISMVMSKLPRVTTVHSNADYDRLESPKILRVAFVLLENMCLKKSNKVIAVSDSIKDLLIKRGVDASKIFVVHNSVKHIEYPARVLKYSSGDCLKLCFVGRLEKVKGCEYLIRALRDLKGVNFHCDIYGEGSLKDELVQLTSSLGLNEKVYFRGFSNRIREILPEYDVMVLPSLFEAFPLSVLEAMNARVLIVSTSVGGMTGIIEDHKNGYLFNRGDFKQLATILEYIHKNPQVQEQITANAYGEYTRKYTEEIMFQNTFKVLHDAVLA